MRIVRFLDSADQVHTGVDQGDGTALRIQGDIFANYTVTRQKVAVQKLLAPVVPAAILCIGINYGKHMEETGAARPQFPVLFMKNPSALANPGDPIVLPRHLRSDEVDWECELAVVIGKRCKNVAKEKSLEYVLGYCAANDVSARDWQKKWGGGQFCRGKSFDSFCPLGPAIVTRDVVPNVQGLGLKTWVNGELVQDSNTSEMIFDVASLVSFLSGGTTLMPGTVILTGTPSGVGMGMKPARFLKAGDKVKVSVEGVGELVSEVVEEG